jgi:hypothetical protein
MLFVKESLKVKWKKVNLFALTHNFSLLIAYRLCWQFFTFPIVGIDVQYQLQPHVSKHQLDSLFDNCHHERTWFARLPRMDDRVTSHQRDVYGRVYLIQRLGLIGAG